MICFYCYYSEEPAKRRMAKPGHCDVCGVQVFKSVREVRE